jgi:hypothetical protein
MRVVVPCLLLLTACGPEPEPQGPPADAGMARPECEPGQVHILDQDEWVCDDGGWTIDESAPGEVRFITETLSPYTDHVGTVVEPMLSVTCKDGESDVTFGLGDVQGSPAGAPGDYVVFTFSGHDPERHPCLEEGGTTWCPEPAGARLASMMPVSDDLTVRFVAMGGTERAVFFDLRFFDKVSAPWAETCGFTPS